MFQKNKHTFTTSYSSKIWVTLTTLIKLFSLIVLLSLTDIVPRDFLKGAPAAAQPEVN